MLSALTGSAARFTILVGSGGNNYSPATLDIKLGDEVEFKWVSGFHPTASLATPEAWSEFVPSGQQLSTIIPASAFKVGQYPYRCTVHPEMLGFINVKEKSVGLAAAQTVPAAALNLFPNPSRGTVNVTLNERPGNDFKLRLRNIIGQEVRMVALRPQLSGVTLDLSDLPAGMYFYSLLVDNKVILTKRLTLQ